MLFGDIVAGNIITAFFPSVSLSKATSRQLARSNKTDAFLMIREQIRAHSAYALAVACVTCVRIRASNGGRRGAEGSASENTVATVCARSNSWLTRAKITAADRCAWERVCLRTFDN